MTDTATTPSTRDNNEQPARPADRPPQSTHIADPLSFDQNKRLGTQHITDDLPPPPDEPSLWFSADPSKANYERFSLIWAPTSMFLLLAVLLGTPLYKHCDRNMLLAITVVFCLPGILVPLLSPCDADRHRPLRERFWVKATIWIIIFDFYGNYFWTHYFYQMLGAKYLFDSHRFNDVPVLTFTATFFYFSFYFPFANVLLRRVDRAVADFPRFGRRLVWIVAVAGLSYATALFEALSIQHFPLYTYTERSAFLLVGSVVYGLYFVVGFPAFFALDEPDAAHPDRPVRPASLLEAAASALAATAVVTLLLDLWRLAVGSIYELGLPSAKAIKVPFIYQPGPESAAPAFTCAPTPTPHIIVVDRPVTVQACAALAKKWAAERLPSMGRFG